MSSSTLVLACNKPFDPRSFGSPFDPRLHIETRYTIWRGSDKGDGLEGAEDRDVRADALPSVDWERVLLDSHLREGEVLIYGEEKLQRAIGSGNIQLGGKAFLSLWEDYQTNRWNSVLQKLRRKGIMSIYFFGLRVRDLSGNRCVPGLCVNGSRWFWNYGWLGGQFSATGCSASFASLPTTAMS